MPLPGSPRDRKRAFLQEIVEVEEQQQPSQPEFLQEIKEPVHEETLVEEKPKRTRRSRNVRSSD